MKRIVMGSFAAIVAAVTGCGAPTLGSCTAQQSGAQLCIEYSAEGTAVTADQLRAQCAMQSGTYAAGACTGAGRTGRCVQTFSNGAMSFSQTYSFYPPIDTANAMMFCTRLNGTWLGN